MIELIAQSVWLDNHMPPFGCRVGGGLGANFWYLVRCLPLQLADYGDNVNFVVAPRVDVQLSGWTWPGVIRQNLWAPTRYPSSTAHPVHLDLGVEWEGPIRSFRRCFDCGSVHPADLAADKPWFDVDWDEGEHPHKLYVCQGQKPAIPFFTQHLADPELDPKVRDLLERRFGLRFEFRDGLMRCAPYA